MYRINLGLRSKLTDLFGFAMKCNNEEMNMLFLSTY